MKKTTLIICLLLLSLGVFSKEPMRIACIGNSITYGSGISSREKNSYPAQLQAYLGKDYLIENFGQSGATALHQGDYPYMNTEVYKASLDFNPEIVFIKLGTNDSKPQNIKYVDEFKADYLKLINSYKKNNPNVRIILLSPTKCTVTNSTIRDEVIQKGIAPLIQEVAFEQNIELIDLYRIFGEKPDSSILPDQIHPSSIGAGIIAKRLHLYLTAGRTEKEIKQSGKPFNFHGFKGYSNNSKGYEQYVVQPKLAAKGHPWVLRARFWGHEPQVDIMLLEQGFHIMYCDVADLYGSELAINRWDSFYKEMRKQGFAKKVVLEGMSRGGLIVYNWANQNADKVACIYADAPVLDIKSWPMAIHRDNPSELDIQQILKAYQLENKSDLISYSSNPLNHAQNIAKVGYPILHVVGDADDIVPIEENTTPFEQIIKENGGDIQVIHKTGVGHHPHSLYNPIPIVEFILKATNRLPDYYSLAIPGNEYRSGAGWKGNSNWHDVSDEINQVLCDNRVDILFLGNSITQGLSNKRELVNYKPGMNSQKKYLSPYVCEAAGISGDKIQQLIWRVEHGNYELSQPKYVVISIGVNNIIGGEKNITDMVKAYRKLVNICTDKFKGARIILLGLLPTGQSKDNENRLVYNKIQHELSRIKWSKQVLYINPTPWFVQEDGTLIEGLYGGDAIHLTEKGYDVWCSKIAQIINNGLH